MQLLLRMSLLTSHPGCVHHHDSHEILEYLALNASPQCSASSLLSSQREGKAPEGVQM